MRYLPDDNLKYPVRLKSSGSTGSGFYLRMDTGDFYFVTAAHVLYDPKENRLRADSCELISYDKENDSPIAFSVVFAAANINYDLSKDIALIKIGSTENRVISLSSGISRVLSTTETVSNLVSVGEGTLRKMSDALESNEVFIIGYPSSLSNEQLNQIEYDRPLLRKGIIAGKNQLNGTIILDCPVYYGNSGGLAIEVDVNPTNRRYFVIGVVTQFVPFFEKITSAMGYQNVNVENSGYSIVVPSDVILAMIQANG